MFCKIAMAAATVIFVVGCGMTNDANQSSKTSEPRETTSASMVAKNGPPEGTNNFQNLSDDHVEGSVDYGQIPPVGGDHAPTWQNCGFYPGPVRSETAVHSMEHGAVWITYHPGLPTGQVDKLRGLANNKTYVLVSLYPDLPAPVVASAWGKQLRLDSAEDPRLEQFVSAFRQGPQTPEPGAPCTGGTSRTVSQPVGAHEEEAKARTLAEQGEDLQPGEYTTKEFQPALSFSVGEGWQVRIPEMSDVFDIGQGASGISFFNAQRVFDPKEPKNALRAPDDIVAWLQEHPYLDAEKPTQVTIGSASGVEFDVVVSSIPENYPRDCPEPCVPLFAIRTGGAFAVFESERIRFIVLEDVKGETVTIAVGGRAVDFEEFFPKAQKVLDTVEWKGA